MKKRAREGKNLRREGLTYGRRGSVLEEPDAGWQRQLRWCDSPVLTAAL